MKRYSFGALAIVVFVLSMGVGIAAAGGGRTFTAHLSGDNEVPPVETNATGQALLWLNKEGDALTFMLTAAGLEGVTQAHIHCGAPGVNGPVVAFLFPLTPAPGFTGNGRLSLGNITDVIVRPDSPECPGGVATFDDLIEKMRTGGAYVNIHTVDNPGGEVRGPVK